MICPHCNKELDTWEPINADDVVQKHATQHRTTMGAVYGYSRRQNVVDARHGAIRELRSMGAKIPDLARLFDKDRTTILHVCKERKRQVRKVLVSEFVRIEEKEPPISPKSKIGTPESVAYFNQVFGR